MNRERQAGFTFLEVMVAVAIIAISFVTLIGSQSQSVSIAGDSRFYVDAALLAQQKMTEIELTGFDEVSADSGDFGNDFPAFRWRTEVTDVGEAETGIPGADDMLKQVDLVVFLDDEGVREYGIRTIVMRRPEPKKK